MRTKLRSGTERGLFCEWEKKTFNWLEPEARKLMFRAWLASAKIDREIHYSASEKPKWVGNKTYIDVWICPKCKKAVRTIRRMSTAGKKTQAYCSNCHKSSTIIAGGIREVNRNE